MTAVEETTKDEYTTLEKLQPFHVEIIVVGCIMEQGWLKKERRKQGTGLLLWEFGIIVMS